MESDDLSWWEGEVFDAPLHIPVRALRGFLRDVSEYPDDQALVEGMVFLELPNSGIPQFIPFSYQSRATSKQIYNRLLQIDRSERDDADDAERST